MSGWDTGQIYFSDPVSQGERDLASDPAVAQRQFFDFIRNFRDNNAFIYRCASAPVYLFAPAPFAHRKNSNTRLLSRASQRSPP